MPAQTAPQQDRPAAVDNPAAQLAWKAVEVKVLSGFRLHVCFHDGLEGDVDMDRFVNASDAGVFAELADPTRFAAAYVEPMFGAVTWPGEIDLAPDAMYAEIKARGVWVL